MPERKVYGMIDKDAPVLAFDVSKGSSHCQGFCSFGKPSGKPVEVAHSRSGMAPAAEIAETLKRQTGKDPTVVLETTGVYSEPVVRWAKSIGLEVLLASPLESAKVRKSKVRPTKTDALDCAVIAEVAYTRNARRRTARLSLYSQLYSLQKEVGDHRQARRIQEPIPEKPRCGLTFFRQILRPVRRLCDVRGGEIQASSQSRQSKRGEDSQSHR